MLENYEFIKKKKQTHSLRFHRDFFFFCSCEQTLCRSLDHHSSTTKTFRPNDRYFPFYSSICMKIIVQTMSRWKKRREKRVKWITFIVYVYESCHRINEERSQIRDRIRKKKKKLRTRVTLRGRKRERLSFSLSDRPFCTMSQSIIRTNYFVVIKAVLNSN